MSWHLDILPRAQRELWDSRLSAGFPGWVLYGGTGIALRLGHRVSVDFDFFSSQSLSPLQFREEHGLGGEVLQAASNTLTLLHRGVKLSFFGGLTLQVVERPDFLAGCAVASLADLAACKLAALVNRVEAKDYLDVVALLRHGMALDRMLAFANTVYRGEFPVAVCLKSLVWFDAPELAGIPAEDRALLEDAVLGVERIPEVSAIGIAIGAE